MKVILLQDVAKIGRRSEVVNVPDGYALNKLIPKQMAEAATPANMKKISKLQAEAKAGAEANESRFEDAKKALSENKLEIATEVNEKGHLFKAVHEADIVEVAKTKGINIEESMLKIDSPIKEVGEHTVSLVQGDNRVEFKLEVVKK